ncbi:MAG: hypothetical protein J6S73_02995, partial [Lentisphaeria bacterium]|nr:hypothetical protein [Lentisphaeria bacterium]
EVRIDPETSAVSARIKDLDLKLLQFLMPDMQQFGISGGSVSGEVHWAKDWGANAISGRTELRFAQTSLHAGAWSPEVFDAVVAGQFKLPVSGGALKVESFRLDAEREGSVFLHFGASGSLPLPDGKAELAWQAEGDAVRLLEMFRTSSSAEATAVLRQFAPVRAAGSGKWDFSPEGVTLREHRVELAGRDKSSVQLALDKRDLLWKDPLRQPWKIRWQAACPAVLLPLWPSVHFSGGDFSGSGELGIQRGAAGGAVHGEVQWQDLAGRLYGNPFERFSGGVEFSLSRDGRGVCNLSRSSLYGRVAGKPALRLECSGACVPSTGAFQADVQVRYANEHWLDILLPGRFRSGQLSGRSRIHGDLRKTDWVLNGFFAVDKLRSPGAARAVDGRLQYEFHRRGKALEMPFCNLRLNSGSKVLADLQLQFSVPAAEEQPVKIRFSGAPLDLSSLYAQVSAPSSSAGTRSLAESPDIAPAARERVVLYAGERLKEVQLDLRDMSWGGSQRFALKGDIVLQKNRVTARNMVLDGGGGQLEWGADGMDFPAGMMLAVHGKVGKPFALNPFVSLFFPESGLDGVVESGEWSLNFQRLFTARWGADLQGSSRFRLKNVELPVNAANGPLSRLLLLPVETVVRAEQLIPETWDVRKHFKTLWEHKFSAKSPFSLLKFHSGELVLTASHGDLRIKQMQFTGDPLARLEAAGKMRLISPFELEFDSTVLLCGVQAKLPVRGFLSSPQVAAWQLFSRLPGSTLSGWMDIFSPFNEDGASAEVPFISPFIRLIRDVAGFQE